MKSEALEKGLAVVRKNYENSMKKGKLSAEKLAERTGLIKGSLDYADIRDADIVIEAVFEDLAVKEQVFKKLDATMKPGAILASNTSTLDVDKIAAFTVSLDLPFAMKRFCADNKIENLTNLSDVHNHSFGEHYGVLISGLPIPLLARAIFVVDAKDKLTHVEIVPEIASEPNYETALAALKSAAGA